MLTEAFLTVDQIVLQYDVGLTSLSFYEKQGLLTPLRIGFARYYSKKDRVRLELILKGKKLGFSLGELSQLIASASKSNPAAATESVMSKEDIARLLNSLRGDRNAIDEALAELEKVLHLRPD